MIKSAVIRRSVFVFLLASTVACYAAPDPAPTNFSTAATAPSADADKIIAKSTCKSADVTGAPVMTGQITDAATIFEAAGKAEIMDAIGDFEKVHKNQLTIVSVPSLNNQEIANYTCKLGNLWGIGDKQHDDGILILIAPNERKVRIAIGTGLEPQISNETLQQIINTKMMPEFPKQQYSAGVVGAIKALSVELAS
jgi:uncharacterized protein